MNKHKIAISLDKDILELVDSKVDGGIMRSRSQAIEYFLKKGLSDDYINVLVLLLKGNQQDVALHYYEGKRLIHKQLDFYVANGITKIYLVTQNPRRELREALINTPVEIIEGDVKGDAAALMALKEKIHTSFIVMSGDTYNEFDLPKMIKKHLSQNKIATMGLMTRDNPSLYGSAILDGDSIIDFQEKSRKSNSQIVNAGVYIFKPEIFEFIKGASLEYDVFPKLAKINELTGFFTYGIFEHLS